MQLLFPSCNSGADHRLFRERGLSWISRRESGGSEGARHGAIRSDLCVLVSDPTEKRLHECCCSEVGVRIDEVIGGGNEVNDGVIEVIVGVTEEAKLATGVSELGIGCKVVVAGGDEVSVGVKARQMSPGLSWRQWRP